MKKILILSLFIALTSLKINGQCMYITSIMADACVPGGSCSSSLSAACSCEGMNEIVGLKVGSLPINVTNITFNWPNNSWKGIAASSTLTGALTTSLQATVLGCGKIIEPLEVFCLPMQKLCLFYLPICVLGLIHLQI